MFSAIDIQDGASEHTCLPTNALGRSENRQEIQGPSKAADVIAVTFLFRKTYL